MTFAKLLNDTARGVPDNKVALVPGDQTWSYGAFNAMTCCERHSQLRFFTRFHSFSHADAVRRDHHLRSAIRAAGLSNQAFVW